VDDGIWQELTTGSQYDVQFSDMKKEYSLALPIFDNAQVRIVSRLA